MKTIRYYDLQDLLKKQFTEAEIKNIIVGKEFSKTEDEVTYTALRYLIYKTIGVDVSTSTGDIGSTDANKLFCVFVGNRHLHDCISFEDKDATIDFSEWLSSYINMYNCTKDKYLKLLSLYASQESHLMDKLSETVSVSHSHNNTITDDGEQSDSRTSTDTYNTTDLTKTNDTPQGTGDFSDDTHVSIINKATKTGTVGIVNGGKVENDNTRTDVGQSLDTTTREYDTDHIINELADIQAKYMNIYKSWAREFDRLFFYE